MTTSTPSVSFLIPTLNAAHYLRDCLQSIRMQDYPQDLVEIIVSDGGSEDETRAIAAEFGARVIENPARTAEAGKAEAVRAAAKDVLAYIDSDNELVGTDWLRRMTAPFADPDVVSSECLRWAYVHEDGLVNRYCALTGINDPASLFVGNYGRYSYLTGKWTGYPVHIEQRDGWEKVRMLPSRVPTMGANGYLVRRRELQEVLGDNPYVFDIDLVVEMVEKGHDTVARVDVPIRHKFARDTRDYMRKTRRRAQDYLHHQGRGERNYDWPRSGLVKFVLGTVTVVPVVAQAIVGFRRRPDLAWAYHPVACGMTLGVYVEAVVRSLMKKGQFDRTGWKQ